MTPIQTLDLSRALKEDPLANANHVALLIPEIQRIPEGSLGEMLLALESFFNSEGKWEAVGGRDGPSDLKRRYVEWFAANLRSFKGALLKRLASETDKSVKQTMLMDVMLQLVVGERVGEFNNEFFQQMMEVVVTSADSSMVLGTMCEKYGTCTDLCYFTFKALAKACQKQKRETGPCGMETLLNIKSEGIVLECVAVETFYTELLESLPKTLEECRDANGDLRSLCAAAEAGIAVPAATGYPAQRKRKKLMQTADTRGVKWMDAKEHQKQFSAAWNGFLALSLPSKMMLDVLEKIPSDVMPNLATPLTLGDFLTQALDHGGTCGLLALNGIFLLMTEHNLEYPEFYKRVYGLLTAEVFYWENRSTFFKLLDVFLKSGLVPAYTVAAFVKRFARLALVAPPAGAIVCISFMHNLIRRHPACNVLLDRQPRAEAERLSAAEWHCYDCFDSEEADPSLSRAIESSLWESEALGNHWCHQVAAHAQILLRDLTTRAKHSEEKIENIASVSYASLLEQTLRNVHSL